MNTDYVQEIYGRGGAWLDPSVRLQDVSVVAS